jgi:hypothetical protein
MVEGWPMEAFTPAMGVSGGTTPAKVEMVYCCAQAEGHAASRMPIQLHFFTIEPLCPLRQVDNSLPVGVTRYTTA